MAQKAPWATEGEKSLPATGKPSLKNATPQTKEVLAKASPYYKIRLITDHPFPESVGCKSRFAEDAWKKAHKVLGPVDKIKFNSQVEKSLHSIGNTFRGSGVKELCDLAVIEYKLEHPLSEVSQRKVEGLLLDGSFMYETVFFEQDGSIMRHSLDRNGSFCFKNLPSNDGRLEFCASDYAPIFNETILALQNFQCNEPKKFEELQKKFGKRSTAMEEIKALMKGVTRGLSDADIVLELENRNRAHSQQIAVQASSSTVIASANAVQSQATATATIQANTFSVQLPNGAYPHYPLPYGFPGVRSLGMSYLPPPQGSFKGTIPPNQWPHSNGAAPPQT
ncbi:hypothetical protein M422DRAFT_267525 [Sphaerobolus stellatus SS14]|uniref:DUF6532 domain-containing protein n=1 Tax=Sphaerobolus stellatus (strain SS14) TaxID=990650 RepID=A0A0C9U909_SPHS4|nr:hypothetical protein M422DRAFT_267525 [Sphaerobolus stellatus SS14]